MNRPRSSFPATLLVVGLLACAGDGATSTNGPYDFAFIGDITFHNPHPAHTIHVAVVRAGDGAKVAETTGVTDTTDPAFSFDFPGILEHGEAYRLHYWIDSNFKQSGTEGVCDVPEVDHQWNRDLGIATGDITRRETHDASTIQDVCATFE